MKELNERTFVRTMINDVEQTLSGFYNEKLGFTDLRDGRQKGGHMRFLLNIFIFSISWINDSSVP